MQKSRYITAFQTEDSAKRFEHLICGLNSAPEQLQQHFSSNFGGNFWHSKHHWLVFNFSWTWQNFKGSLWRFV